MLDTILDILSKSDAISIGDSHLFKDFPWELDDNDQMTFNWEVNGKSESLTLTKEEIDSATIDNEGIHIIHNGEEVLIGAFLVMPTFM